MVSLILPGERVLIPIFDRFGHLLHEIVERCGAEVFVLEKPWGSVFEPDEVIAAMETFKPHVVAMVHGENSTGRMQPLAEIGRACRRMDALFIVDAVATIGGIPVETDVWMLDAVVGCTQKCLSVPSGMAPITYNDRAEAKLMTRKRVERGIRTSDVQPGELSFVRSNYFDLGILQDYWSPQRLNHHIEMTSMLYALREGLRLTLEEGLDARFARHILHEKAFVAGLTAMGLELYGDPSCKLTVVTCVLIPEGIDGESVRSLLLERFGIEIASSFGPLKGKIWRIGTMGFSCRTNNVLRLLGALEAALLRHGFGVSCGLGVQAALDVYEENVR